MAVMETMPSWPSMALRRSTKLRAGSTGVRTTPMVLQSYTPGTGRICPRAVATQARTSSSPRSTASVWGYSRNAISRLAWRTIASVRWVCGSSSAPITTEGPTISRTRLMRSPSQSSQPSAAMAPCRPSSTISTGIAAFRSSSRRARSVSWACRVVVPPGTAKATRPSLRCRPSSSLS